ncbi:L-aspartate oxidase [Georgenia ruanii]|uniref:L-aspartate oxidase n=1 Tax=Georgenia ruanii TaxID=348442 RepID=A0A7J9V0Y7_9MICO|nr:L-aspartate oxidase [Georgenia ruanii]MPV90541.1 L-aspartate oxidase [Georgenia ruanii]
MGAAPPQDRPVIVGGGLAGLLTAVHLAPLPCVVLTTGRLAEHTSSALAQGGIAAALDPGDSPLLHALDTLHAGAGLSDPGTAERITAAAPAAVEHLAALGARFDRTPDGGLALGLEAAHSRHRVAHAGGDATGHEVLRAAIAAVRATPSITVLENARALRVLTADDGRVAGVVAAIDGAPGVIRTDRVVLATGGAGGLFRHTTNPTGSRGQGLALAGRAGAELRDLEMVQFHPTALDVGLDPMPLVTEALRGAGARLVDAAGDGLLEDDLAPRDVVARAVFATLQRGERVFLDARETLGAGFAAHFPTVAAACRAAGIDPIRDPVPVRPAAHYLMGGVSVDGRGRTSVPGLWAVGEVASTGLHGANRLASNSLLEAAVCARWVAEDLAGQDRRRRCRPGGASSLPRWAAIPTRGAGQLRALMSETVGVVRDGPSLTRAVDQLGATVERTGLDATDDATLVALLLATSALRREESRGAHLRTDFPAAAEPRHLTLTLAAGLAGLDDLATPAFRRSAS